MIISFYSYKGGVGRTQLCANVASYLCYEKHKRVLLWDWDFEAPGLHYFFNLKHENILKKGTIEILGEYCATMRKNSEVTSSNLKYITKEDNITSLVEAKEKSRGSIDLLSAGIYDKEFNGRVNEFDWFDFYTLLDGVNYIEKLKDYLNDKRNLGYDYVLIDSRTGISDYSGICNIQLPEINVFVIAPTMQNFEGCKSIIDRIINSEYLKISKRKPYILPILSRLDLSNLNSNSWIDKFTNEFSHLLLHLDVGIDKPILKEVFNDIYRQKTFLQYFPGIATGENIFFTPGSTPNEYSKYFATIADFIDTLTREGNISFYKMIDEATWKRYAEDAIKSKNSAKLSIANRQLILIQTPTKETAQIIKERNAQVKELIEASDYRNYKKERNRYFPWLTYVSIVGLTALIVFYLVKKSDSSKSAANKNESVLTLDEQKRFYFFVASYTASGQQSDFDYNLEKMREYYTLNTSFDSGNLIKNKIIDQLTPSFLIKVDSFFFCIRKKQQDVQNYLADTLIEFGSFKKVPKGIIYQKILSGLEQQKNVQNRLVETTFVLTSDSSGFRAAFTEFGNYNIENFTEFKSIRNLDTMVFDYNAKIKAYKFRILDTVSLMTPIPPRVYIHISNESQIKMGQLVRSELRARNFIVPGIENVGKKSNIYIPYKTEVRYYRDEDRGEALRLISVLKQLSLGIEIIGIPQKVQGLGTEVRPRHYEIWFYKSPI